MLAPRNSQCHAGKSVQHIYNIGEDKRKGIAPSPNLRQVHLIPSELFDEGKYHGKRWWGAQRVRPGQTGENISTAGIDFLALSKGTQLQFISNKAEEDRMRRLPTIMTKSSEHRLPWPLSLQSSPEMPGYGQFWPYCSASYLPLPAQSLSKVLPH